MTDWGANILPIEDAGFEGGTIGHWGPYQSCDLANSIEQAHSGTHSLKIVATGQDPIAMLGYPFPIPITENTPYRVSFWAQCFSSMRTAAVNIWWLDAGGALIGSLVPSVSAPQGEWASVMVDTVSPLGAVTVQLVVAFNGAGAGEVFFIDDIGVFAPAIPVEPPVKLPCVRKAWLTQGGERIELEDVESGWVCTSLDLGWPEVREVMNNRPDQDGTDDQTKFFGARAVSADIKTTGRAARPDEIASAFGRFMYPGQRSQLHYVLDRGDNAERVLVVRPSGYGWPIEGGGSREVSLSWIAADPVARAVEATVCTTWTGPSSPGGRTYNLRYNRFYSASGGSAIAGTPVSKGEVPVEPLLRIYGPVTGPQVGIDSWLSGVHTAHSQVVFDQGFIIEAGSYVEVDCRYHTARVEGDIRRSVASAIQWTLTSWPVIALPPETNRLTMYGSSTDGRTQVQAIWRDGFLT